jgi:DNA-binding CsgD family transcriptional regulator
MRQRKADSAKSPFRSSVNWKHSPSARLYDMAMPSDLRHHPFDHARLQLAYGSWLRRHRRVSESRAPLRAAREVFDALGATPWGERARQELRASGEQSREPVPAPRDLLSTQELQIAQMAATGMTNREIGHQLYLSPRTVGSHLYRLFPKLGVTSRNQLAAALDAACHSPGGIAAQLASTTLSLRNSLPALAEPPTVGTACEPRQSSDASHEASQVATVSA